MNRKPQARRIDPGDREALKRTLNDEIERGFVQVRTGQGGNLDALFDELGSDLASEDV